MKFSAASDTRIFKQNSYVSPSGSLTTKGVPMAPCVRVTAQSRQQAVGEQTVLRAGHKARLRLPYNTRHRKTSRFALTSKDRTERKSVIYRTYFTSICQPAGMSVLGHHSTYNRHSMSLVVVHIEDQRSRSKDKK